MQDRESDDSLMEKRCYQSGEICKQLRVRFLAEVTVCAEMFAGVL